MIRIIINLIRYIRMKKAAKDMEVDYCINEYISEHFIMDAYNKIIYYTDDTDPEYISIVESAIRNNLELHGYRLELKDDISEQYY